MEAERSRVDKVKAYKDLAERVGILYTFKGGIDKLYKADRGNADKVDNAITDKNGKADRADKELGRDAFNADKVCKDVDVIGTKEDIPEAKEFKTDVFFADKLININSELYWVVLDQKTAGVSKALIKGFIVLFCLNGS